VVDSEADSGGRVHLIDTRTGVRRPIPTRSWGEFDAAWSADGDLLAFLSTPERWDPIALDLVVTQPDGTRRRTIARDVVGFAWARTGKRLAYITEDGRLFVRDGPDGPPRANGRVDGFFLEWSPTDDALLVKDGGRARVVPLAGGRPVEVANAAKAAWLPDGRVLFSGYKRLQVIRVGADEPTELIRPFSYVGASWSPDGRRLVYVRADPGYGDGRGSIVVEDVDRRASTVVGNGQTPSWSPEGDRLAFEHEGDVYVTSLTGETARITSGSERDRMPVWSAQGDMLAFTRSVGPPSGQLLASAACVVVVASSAVGCSNALRRREPALIEEGPEWSPADDVVAYSSYANEPKGYYVFAEACFLAGPSARKRGCVKGEELSASDWSVDGEALVVVGAVDGGIGVASRTGRLISGLPGYSDSTAWAPKGRMLAAGGDALSVVDARPGAQPKRLVAARVGRPAWSPDASWIAYATAGEIAVIRADGRDAQPIARMPAEVEYLLWSPRTGGAGR
jgi:Tol biopolymer transport system component